MAAAKASLASTHGELVARFWDAARNTLTPADVTAGMKSVAVAFVCEAGHRFSCTPAEATRRKLDNFCSLCSSAAAHYPELMVHWDYSKNPKAPENTSHRGGRGGFWLTCRQGHSFHTPQLTGAPLDRCPTCRTFALRYPALSVYWHPTRNVLSAEEFIYSSSIPHPWFKCSQGHEFQASEQRVKRHLGEFCPRCATPTVSDTYPELASFWDRERNSLGPEQVAAQATGTFHFRCTQGHEFSTTLNNFPKQKRNFCPECRLASHSFEAEVPLMALFWDSERNGGGPETVMAGAAGRFWFMCTEKHSFSTTLSQAKLLQGRCPHCDSQTSRLEREVQAFVLNELKEYAKLNTRAVIAPYELDLYLPKQQVAVEVNGDYYHSEAFFATKKSRFATAEDYHHHKFALCEAAGIRLAFVWGHAWTSHRAKVQVELTRFVREQEGPFPLLSRQQSVLDLSCTLCDRSSPAKDSV